jgi:hypothetical protein
MRMTKWIVAAIGALGIALSIIGCDEAKTDKPAKSAADATTAIGNRPPKAPDCPASPELPNLRLPDGETADVRIFRDGNDTFYIPLSWYRWEAGRDRTGVDATDNSGLAARLRAIANSRADKYWANFWANKEAGRFSFEVHEVECPGVIHEGWFGYTTPRVWVPWGSQMIEIPPNFYAESKVDKVFFGRRDLPDSMHMNVDEYLGLGASGNGWARIRVSEKYFAEYDYRVRWDARHGSSEKGPIWDAFRADILASENWKLTRDSVRDLYAWLKTPPKDRDNNRLFKLGSKD